MRRLVLLSTVFVIVFSYFAFPLSAQGQYCVTAQIPVTNNSGNSVRVYAHIGDWFHVPASLQVYAEGPRITLSPGASATASVSVLLSESQASNAWWGLIALDTPYPTIDFSGVAFNRNAPLDACGTTIPQINDGRINATDLAAPMAAYCQSGGMEIWYIDAEGQGTLAFTVSADDISTALDQAVASQQNQLIAEGMGDQLYALMSNELALVGLDVKEPGKLYQRVLPADVCG